MDSKSKTTFFIGLGLLGVIFLIDLLLFNDLYFTGIAAIILGVIAMSVFIMQDSASLPDIGVILKDDAKGIRIINRGNDTAYTIHIAIIPINVELDIPELGADAIYEHQLSAMLAEAKAVVTYKNVKGVEYSHTILISALGRSDDDLLKPMFPLFRWK